jgi:hypothetical protein
LESFFILLVGIQPLYHDNSITLLRQIKHADWRAQNAALSNDGFGKPARMREVPQMPASHHIMDTSFSERNEARIKKMIDMNTHRTLPNQQFE